MRLVLAIGLAALAYYYSNHHELPWNLTGGPMDGTVWDVRVKPNSWFAFSHQDTLLFDSGRVTAVKLLAAGYSAGSYSASGTDGRLSWQASSDNGKSGTLEWTGRIVNDHIEGEIVQRDLDGRIRQLRFRGIRKIS